MGNAFYLRLSFKERFNNKILKTPYIFKVRKIRLSINEIKNAFFFFLRDVLNINCPIKLYLYTHVLIRPINCTSYLYNINKEYTYLKIEHSLFSDIIFFYS